MSTAQGLGYIPLATVSRVDPATKQDVQVELYRCPRCYGTVDDGVLREHRDWHDGQITLAPMTQ